MLFFVSLSTERKKRKRFLVCMYLLSSGSLHSITRIELINKEMGCHSLPHFLEALIRFFWFKKEYEKEIFSVENCIVLFFMNECLSLNFCLVRNKKGKKIGMYFHSVWIPL